ncbi:hypothetical protein Zmor_015108 [Zophobas morio]|uniref:Uncharacterized protein n=1 Tax=Zophobas morio TaxID=2755281 RepID=A0AA38MHA4_9CUCU|nr:hypothetical protein Zmor_015108 [Zophobas morio]
MHSMKEGTPSIPIVRESFDRFRISKTSYDEIGEAIICVEELSLGGGCVWSLGVEQIKTLLKYSPKALTMSEGVESSVPSYTIRLGILVVPFLDRIKAQNFLGSAEIDFSMFDMYLLYAFSLKYLDRDR